MLTMKISAHDHDINYISKATANNNKQCNPFHTFIFAQTPITK